MIDPSPLLGPLLHPLLASTGAGLIGTVLTKFNPQTVAAKVLIVIVFATSCAYGGWKLAKAFDAQEKVAELNAEIALREYRGQLVTKIEKHYVDRVVEIMTQGVNTRVEVPVYVTKKADDNCVVPVGFVELHNAAAEMRPARPTADPDAPAKTVKLSTVADTLTSNYTECHIDADIVRGWQEYYAGLKNGKVK